MRKTRWRWSGSCRSRGLRARNERERDKEDGAHVEARGKADDGFVCCSMGTPTPSLPEDRSEVFSFIDKSARLAEPKLVTHACNQMCNLKAVCSRLAPGSRCTSCAMQHPPVSVKREMTPKRKRNAERPARRGEGNNKRSCNQQTKCAELSWFTRRFDSSLDMISEDIQRKPRNPRP